MSKTPALIVLTGAAALLAGCGSVEAKDTVTEATSADKVVSVNVTEPSNGLLPSDTSDMSGWKIVSQLYDGLVTFDAEGNETLVEAESITPNDDASEYTIVLKPNLTFSNGEKITADTLFIYDADGTMHVLITPEIRGTPESVAEAEAPLKTKSPFLGAYRDRNHRPT